MQRFSRGLRGALLHGRRHHLPSRVWYYSAVSYV